MTTHLTDHCGCVLNHDGTVAAHLTQPDSLRRFRELLANNVIEIEPCPASCPIRAAAEPI